MSASSVSSCLDLSENSKSVPVDSAPAGLPAGTPDGAGSPGVVLSSSGNSSVPVSGGMDGAGPLEDNAALVLEDGASSQAVSQLILAAVSGPGESVDSRDNQLDELVSPGSIGVVTNSSNSLFGAVVYTPNSNLSVEAGDQPPNSNSLVVNGTVNSELLKNGNNDISNNIVNSELNKNDDNNISDEITNAKQ